MGKLLVILVGAMGFVASTLLYSAQTSTLEADQRLNEHAAKVLAREVALTGLNEGTQLVFDSFEASGSYTGPSTLTGLHDGGGYQVDLNISGTSITLKAVGTFNRARHTLSRSYTYLQSGGGTVPPFMGRPVTCNGNLVVRDDFNLTDCSYLNPGHAPLTGSQQDPSDPDKVIICHFPPGDEENVQIISISMSALQTHISHHDDYDGDCVCSEGGDGDPLVHANGNLRFEGGDALITGFGSYGGNLELLNGQSESDIFQPNSGGTPLTEQVDDIDIPLFMPEAYEGIATVATYGNVMLSGTVALGTQANPKIWYIDGNLMTTGSVTFTGYGVFVVRGNIEIYNDVITEGASEESTVGFYTSGNITMKKADLNMAGQWFLNGNVELDSGSNFTGTITNTGSCYFENIFNMGYRSASPAITQPFWPTPGTLILVEAQEW